MDVSDVPELSSAPTPKLSALICLSNAFKSRTLRHTELQQKHQTHNPLLFFNMNTDTQQTLPITAMKQTEREKSHVKGCSSLLILASNFKTEKSTSPHLGGLSTSFLSGKRLTMH